LVSFVSFLAIANNTSLESQNPNFHVHCELNGQHGNDPDRLKHVLEIKLLKEAIDFTYEFLEPHLKKIAPLLSLEINHSAKIPTKNFLGWSAEDDGIYKYPNTEYYHSLLNSKGLIRTNYTEKLLQILHFGDKLGGNAKQGALVIARSIIIHELTHAYQYNKAPTQDIAHAIVHEPSLLIDGLVDRQLLKQNKIKIEYEHDAFAAQRASLDPNAIEFFIVATQEFLSENNDFLMTGQGFNLLSKESLGINFENYLEGIISSISLGRKFSLNNEKLYNAQVVPPEIVLELVEINESLNGNSPSREIINTVNILRKRWDIYLSDNTYFFGYLESVANRYHRELNYFESLIKQN